MWEWSWRLGVWSWRRCHRREWVSMRTIPEVDASQGNGLNEIGSKSRRSRRKRKVWKCDADESTYNAYRYALILILLFIFGNIATEERSWIACCEIWNARLVSSTVVGYKKKHITSIDGNQHTHTFKSKFDFWRVLCVCTLPKCKVVF